MTYHSKASKGLPFGGVRAQGIGQKAFFVSKKIEAESPSRQMGVQ